MWSPNEISKQEKQRDIFAYITLPFFQVKKGSLSTFRFVPKDFLCIKFGRGGGYQPPAMPACRHHQTDYCKYPSLSSRIMSV